MPDRKLVIFGWIQALVAVLVFWSVSNVFLGYTIRTQGGDPLVYSCSVFVSASLVLLLFAGSGPLAKETMRSIDTWGYGIALMLNYIVLLALLALVTSTEATLLQSVAVLMSMVSGWFFLGRRLGKTQFLGAVLIAVGLYLVASDLNVESLGKAIVIIISMGLIQTIRTYIAEFHRPNAYAHAQAVSVKDRARVIALVMFVVSSLFFAFFFGFSVLVEKVDGLEIPMIPDFEDFFNSYTIFYGMIAGVLLIAPLRYFEFSATNSIKTENYLAVSAFAPIATWFWEWATSPLTGINLRDLSYIDAVACLLITLGGLVIAIRKMRQSDEEKQLKNYLIASMQDPQEVQDSREIIANTVQHYDGDYQQAAKALDLPFFVVDALIYDKQKMLAFKPDVLKEVARAYRKKVAMSDALTGLANRAGFMTTLKGAPYEADKFSLLYIDLDKFKPVNDTYGHEAGDAVLKAVAERMTEMFPFRALPTRLGGDEFAVLVLDADREKAETLAKELKAKVIEPIMFEGQEIAVGASVGIACFPEDGTDGEKLLKIADGGMYAEKGEGGSSR